VRKDLSREIADLRAQARFAEKEQHRMLLEQLRLETQADKLEDCLLNKRCLNRDLKEIREHAGPHIYVTGEDDGFHG
jgi:hypothetical protein